MPPSASIPTSRVLVIDDEPDLRTLYELTLLREGYQVETAGSVSEAWQVLGSQAFAVVITDMRLPDGMGTEILTGLKEQRRSERCVVITAYGSAENAVESLKAGAFDYLTKPVDLKQFRSVIAAAVKLPDTATSRDKGTLAHPKVPNGIANSGDTALSKLVGESALMRQVKEKISKVARSMAPVLVQGESGTGKELVAFSLHANSHRSGGPWVPVNCSAIPENLLEAEFFGAKKGSYTGSHADRDGFFKSANGGTLFLDEIGDLPLSMQSKLLRAIQERRIRPVGSDQEESVDVRIVSATHRDLQDEIAAGRFRQDLFYRINVINVSVPPLRDRTEDLPALCSALLKRIAAESGEALPQIAPDFVHQLSTHHLTGNVRELENILHRAYALCEGGVLRLDDMDSQITGPSDLTPSTDRQPETLARVQAELPSDLQSHLDQQERDILIQTLKETGFNRTLAAHRLGLTLRQIRYRITRLGIEVPNTQGDDIEG